MLPPKRFHPSSAVAYPQYMINQEHSCQPIDSDSFKENSARHCPAFFSGSNMSENLRPTTHIRERKMLRLSLIVTLFIVSLSWIQPAGAQTNTATHVSAADVTATLKQGEARLAEENRSIATWSFVTPTWVEAISACQWFNEPLDAQEANSGVSPMSNSTRFITWCLEVGHSSPAECWMTSERRIATYLALWRLE